ncbi:MAG: hypothetical protein IKS65_00015, partial [Bacteroidales bacterium]|nr:hypothetical protein [Bacteroidales bacterium]
IKGQNVDFFRGYKFINLSTKNADGTLHYKAKMTFFLAGDDIKNADFKLDVFSKTEFDFEYKNLKIEVEGLPLKD